MDQNGWKEFLPCNHEKTETRVRGFRRISGIIRGHSLTFRGDEKAVRCLNGGVSMGIKELPKRWRKRGYEIQFLETHEEKTQHYGKMNWAMEAHTGKERGAGYTIFNFDLYG